MARKSQKSRAVQSHKKKNRSEKRSRHLDRNAITLDVSISDSLAQLNLSDGGPICRLPNELVQSILVRLDIQELIHLQAVSKQWQAVIISIGHTKKSILLTSGPLDRNFLKQRTFKQIDLSTFTRINLKSNVKPSKHIQSQFVKLFPAMEQLVYDLSLNRTILDILPSKQLTTLSFLNPIFDSALVGTLLAHINSCTSLKRLDMYAQIKLLPTLAPTFARLEQLSLHRYNFENLGDDFEAYEDEGLSLLRHLGPDCSRVWIQNYDITSLSQWHTINSQWLASVTHLKLDSVPVGHIIHHLSECAFSLQVLSLRSFSTFDNPPMNPQMIGHLSKMSHLSEIGLDWISFDLPQLEEATRNYQLTPLVSIRTSDLQLTDFIGEHDSDRFTFVISTIFPNVEHLKIYHFSPLEGIEQYVNRFPKLQTHLFNYIMAGFE